MRIALATPLYPPEPGGPATYTKLLEEELPARGVTLDIVKFLSVRDLPKGIRHIVYFIKVLGAALRADRVYALDPVSTGLPALLASVIALRPLHLRVAGDYAWEQGTYRFGVTDILDDFVLRDDYPFFVQFLKRVQSFVARSARSVVVPSAYLKRIVAAWGVPEERIHVVYNAPPPFPEPETLARPQEVVRPYLVTVARLVPWKGIDALIRALARLRAEGSELRLVVVGDGPEEANLRTLSTELGLSDYVLFTGRLSHGTAPAYIAHAEAFVLDTRYEGFSHVILEAFALRVPVLTTPVGGNVEAVEDGATGLLFPYGDEAAIAAAVRRVMEEPGLRGHLTSNASALLSRFTREKVADGTRIALSS